MKRKRASECQVNIDMDIQPLNNWDSGQFLIPQPTHIHEFQQCIESKLSHFEGIQV